ncbi:MAG: tetratricopeptide repeat protein [Planctomycetaceae bacterium]|nr:tetratricopeptide repeat protein [Planctomycetaceae bacterium]
MKTAFKLLLTVILLESVAASVVVVRRLRTAVPPVPNLNKLDDDAAEEIQNLRLRAIEGSSEDWRYLAESYLGTGFYLAAERCFDHAAGMAPDDDQAMYGKAFCLERVGKTAEAVEAFKATIRRADPQLAETCWYQIGRCHLRDGNEADAEKSFRKTPNSAAATYQLIRILLRTDRLDEASTLLQEQLAAYPNSLKLTQLQLQLARLRNDPAAVEEWASREQRATYMLVLEYGQSFITMFAARHGVSAVLSQAMQLKNTGTLQERQAALAQALRIIRRNELWNYRSVFLAAAHVEFGLGNLQATRGLISEIRKNSNDGTDILELEGLILQQEGREEEARQIWERALAMKPSVDLHQLLADSYANNVEQQALHQERVRYLRSVEAFRANELSTALEGLQECVIMQPAHAEAWFYLGETNRAIGEFDKAMAGYAQCLRLDPHFDRAGAASEQLKSILQMNDRR